MSKNSLARNRLGGFKVPVPGGYVRENRATFGAGTLTANAAVPLLGSTPKDWRSPNYRHTDGFAAHVSVQPLVRFGNDCASVIPSVWRRITHHEPQECDGRCPAGNPPNAHCRPVPCFPRATLKIRGLEWLSALAARTEQVA